MQITTETKRDISARHHGREPAVWANLTHLTFKAASLESICMNTAFVVTDGLSKKSLYIFNKNKINLLKMRAFGVT